ncbi:MAG: PIN domain-containing protein [Selenomonadaceae bacterium]|nr:PIN domain-containing protein [Selenomonadaceae bacterium]
MELLIDSNVVLDVILNREPFFDASEKVLRLGIRPNITTYVSAASVTDIYYIAYRNLKDNDMVYSWLSRVFGFAKLVSVTPEHIYNAVNLRWRDFEDSVQYSIAKSNGMDGIVTRNMKGFKESDVKIFTPEEILNFVKSQEE